MHSSRELRCVLLLVLVLLALSVAACQPIGAPPPQGEENASASDESSVPPLPTVIVAPAPVRLAIPDLQMDVPVERMNWAVRDGVSTWVLPEDAAGWHPNSAPASGPGNTVISGSQLAGAAVFAPLALGEAAVGQEVTLTDSSGATFTYRISEVADPLPIRGGTAEQAAAAVAYLAADGPTRLTLITGWPDFTTSHRQFVVAEKVEE